MASGKPVVSCRIESGVPYVNQDGITGLVVPPRDPEELAKAIEKLCASPSCGHVSVKTAGAGLRRNSRWMSWCNDTGSCFIGYTGRLAPHEDVFLHARDWHAGVLRHDTSRIRLAFLLGAVDEPNERKIHSWPMARLGGLSVVAGFSAPWFALYFLDNRVARIC